MSDRDEDEDRAAILRRRQLLIAVALTGLTGAAGCDEPPSPPAEPAAHERVAEAEGPDRSPGSGPPMQPVDTDPASEDDERLVEVAPVDDGPADPAEVRHAEEAKRRWQRRAQPHPCLTTIPTVCLSVMPFPQGAPSPSMPTACLFKKPFDDPDDEPA